MKKIGILGGTFDPIHNGHLMIARAAMEEHELSKVYLIPTGISYMKTGVNDSYFRYTMTQLAIEDEKELEISDVEIKREGNTYTCDTIAYFKEQFPEAEICFIIGTDSLFSMEKWRNSEYIFANATILCATRIGKYTEEHIESAELNKANELYQKYNAKISFINCPVLNISSTEIRKYRKEHPDKILCGFEIPEKVRDYIMRHDLYTESTESIHAKLKSSLTPKRYIHTMGVVDVATKLAFIWGCDLPKARLAALLHDCAKYINIKQKCAICAKYNIDISQIELNNPELLHAKVGALIAYEEYNVKNTDILATIFYHTTGRPQMTLLEQIIFVADYIEPGRKHSEKLPFYRELAKKDLNKTTAYILKDTLEYLNSSEGTLIDSRTQDTFDFYSKYL